MYKIKNLPNDSVVKQRKDNTFLEKPLLHNIGTNIFGQLHLDTPEQVVVVDT